jgi:hypothetical protein
LDYDSASFAELNLQGTIAKCGHGLAVCDIVRTSAGWADPWSSSAFRVPWAFRGSLGEAAPNGVDGDTFVRGVGAAGAVEDRHACSGRYRVHWVLLSQLDLRLRDVSTASAIGASVYRTVSRNAFLKRHHRTRRRATGVAEVIRAAGHMFLRKTLPH